VINNNEELISYIKAKRIKSALIGNGFSLSHPEYGEQFEFKIDKILKKLNNLTKDELNKILKNEYEPKCPETGLKGLRYYYIKCVLEEYIEIFSKGKNFHGVYSDKNKKKYHCQNFLKKIDAIFTTNYDPLIYFEILKYNKSKAGNFIDGFNGIDFITQENILKQLDNKEQKKIYYLHGSWFIQVDYDSKKLRKCSFSKDSSDTIESLFNWGNKKLPYLIFEEKSKTKASLIKKSEYFKKCFECLEKNRNPMLVFGLSFKMDDHIVPKLKGKELYITYLEDSDKKALEEKFKKNDIDAEYVKINKNIIWT
jgi:hypothetical protein